MKNTSGKVYLVGAGPGDPDLLTIKAARLLKEADVVLYDRLVSPDVLRLVAPGVSKIFAGKTPGDHHASQDSINEMLVRLARAGHQVVRLKGGDPFVFGRGGEEALHLARHGVDFDVVPGITAALACGAYAGIPLTHRGLARHLHFVAGHCRGDVPLDLWRPEKGTRRIMPNYGRGEQSLPVYKMPHMEGWAMAGDLAFVPALGRHEVLVIDRNGWQERARIPVRGQPVFVIARPDAREVWVNFALPDNDTIQIIDVQSLTVTHTMSPGKAVLHMEFTPRGEQVWVSVRDQDRVDVYDTASYQKLATLPAEKPSGIFLSARAHRIGL